jgi:hypothetical protein
MAFGNGLRRVLPDLRMPLQAGSGHRRCRPRTRRSGHGGPSETTPRSASPTASSRRQGAFAKKPAWPSPTTGRGIGPRLQDGGWPRRLPIRRSSCAGGGQDRRHHGRNGQSRARRAWIRMQRLSACSRAAQAAQIDRDVAVHPRGSGLPEARTMAVRLIDAVQEASGTPPDGSAALTGAPNASDSSAPASRVRAARR